MVVIKLGLVKFKLCGILVKLFISFFFSRSFMILLGCIFVVVVVCCVDWGFVLIIVCIKVKIVCSLECLVVDFGKFRVCFREVFILVIRVCWVLGVWWYVVIVVSKMWVKDGVFLLLVGVLDGRRWFKMNVRIGFLYWKVNNKYFSVVL